MYQTLIVEIASLSYFLIIYSWNNILQIFQRFFSLSVFHCCCCQTAEPFTMSCQSKLIFTYLINYEIIVMIIKKTWLLIRLSIDLKLILMKQQIFQGLGVFFSNDGMFVHRLVNSFKWYFFHFYIVSVNSIEFMGEHFSTSIKFQFSN